MPKTIQPKPGKLFDYGRGASHRWLCLIGVVLIAVSITLLSVWGIKNSSRADIRLVGALGGMGIAAVVTTFSVRGFRFLSDAIHVWNYKYWFSGQNRMISQDDIESIVLKGKPGTHWVSLRLRTGESIELGKKFSRFSEAEIWVGRIAERYGLKIENEVLELSGKRT